jgi:DNA-binding transcriptional MerR regulator
MILTVDQLLAQVNAKIDEAGIRVPDGSRAGRYVDLRAFRFYRTQKIVDPPTRKEGVAGVYSERHLLQLLAVKAQQAQWMPLPEIRKKLANASDEELRQMADSPHAAAGRASGLPPLAAPRTANTPRTWVEFRAGDGAYLMVDRAMLAHSRPSELRVLCERFTSMLMAAGG